MKFLYLSDGVPRDLCSQMYCDLGLDLFCTIRNTAVVLNTIFTKTHLPAIMQKSISLICEREAFEIENKCEIFQTLQVG